MAGGGFLSCIVARSILRRSSLKSRLHDGLGFTHRPLSSSYWGLPYRVVNINHKLELLRCLWVGMSVDFEVLGGGCAQS